MSITIEAIYEAGVLRPPAPHAKQEETGQGPVWLIPETDLHGFQRRGQGRPTKQNELSPKAASTEAPANEAEPTKGTASSRSSTNVEKGARGARKSGRNGKAWKKRGAAK